MDHEKPKANTQKSSRANLRSSKAYLTSILNGTESLVQIFSNNEVTQNSKCVSVLSEYLRASRCQQNTKDT